MLPKSPSYIPDGVCLSCRGCCRFTDTDNCWRPKTFRDEQIGLTANHLDAKGYVTAQGKNAEQWICDFLNPENNFCAVYQKRPFECALYPFVFVRDADEIRLMYHLSCPYAQDTLGSAGYQKHVEILRQYFSEPGVLKFISENKTIAGDYVGYRQELENVFVLPLR